MCFSILRF